MKHDLYYSKFCYFCQKVLMFLHGHQHSIGLKSTSDSTNSRDLMNGGGKTQVPCLRIESSDGEVRWMYESDDILAYIKNQNLVSSG